VYFTLNVEQIPTLKQFFNATDIATIGLMVKTVQLPQYTINTETLNQYNRKRIIQKNITYSPIQIEFHDDGGDVTRNLWYNYYSYYYKDPSQQYGSRNPQNGSISPVSKPGFSYNSRDTYANERPVADWGFIGESYSQSNAGTSGAQSAGDESSGKPPFFRDITIYGMDRRKFAQYTLINPVIKDWRHDTYNYSEGAGTMTNTCTIEYETVKYYAGDIGKTPAAAVKGFADPAYYDKTPSSLSRPGSTRSVLGQGGLLDAGLGIVNDLSADNFNPLGAIQKAAATYNTFKGANLKSVVNEEANLAAKDILKNTLPAAIRQQQNGTSSGGFTFLRNVVK
jgi:hypothetical protein